MRKLRLIAVAALVAALAGAGARAADAPSPAAELLAKLPADTVAGGQEVVAGIVKLGPAGVGEIIKMIVPQGQGDDTKARFALNGIAYHVNRPGAEAERLMYSRALIAGLEETKEPLVKTFLMNMLQLVGKEEAVAPLSKYLADPDLCEPATQALLRTGGKGVVPALLKALPDAKGGNVTTIVRALGSLQAKAAVKAILPYAASEDTDLRRTALYALSTIGDPAAADALAKAANAQGTFERAHATALYLAFARRLGQTPAGKQQCAKICRDLIKERTNPRETNVVCDALAILVQTTGEGASADVFSAANSENKQLRNAALALTKSFPGKATTDKLTAMLKTAPPEARADILYALQVRGDKSAVPAVLAALKDEDLGVRKAAIDAAASFGTSEAAATLLALAPTDPDEAKAVQVALLRLPPAAMASAAATALPKAGTPAEKLALLRFLGAGRAKVDAAPIFACTTDADAGVRVAALKALGKNAEAAALPRVVDLLLKAPEGAEQNEAQKAVAAVCGRITDPDARVAPLLAALAKTTGAPRLLLLQALADAGGKKALTALLAETKSNDEEARNTATQLIGDWEDPDAGPDLLAFARAAQTPAEQALALRGYVRVIGATDRPAAQAVRMYRDALAVCKRPEEKRLVIAGVGGIRDVEALKLVAPLVDDPALAQDALAAILRIASPPTEKDKPLNTPEAVAIIKNLANNAKDGEVRNKLYDFIKKFLQVSGRAQRPDPADLALGKPATASCDSQGPQTPNLAVDGNTTDLNSSWWGVKWPSSLTIDLQKVQKINCIHAFPYFDGGRYYQYTAEVSTDGKEWTQVADRSKNTKPAEPEGDRMEFEPTDARYVRLNMLKNSANEAVHVVEVKVYAPGTEPKPEVAAAGPDRKPDAEGFVPLSEGDSLDGWVGATNGYCAVNGIIACIKEIGGNLYTAKEYSNFVLRFDFRLTPGANNGIGIRAPLAGDAAYVGMEIQVLDDTADIYKTLQPYQYHGSVYGVAPCERGHQKPVGEWNQEEITANGRHITVKLNGATITDVDLDKASENGTMDHKQHPGLKNEKGHVGFLGHGALVEFRNVRIKELK